MGVQAKQCMIVFSAAVAGIAEINAARASIVQVLRICCQCTMRLPANVKSVQITVVVQLEPGKRVDEISRSDKRRDGQIGRQVAAEVRAVPLHAEFHQSGLPSPVEMLTPTVNRFTATA